MLDLGARGRALFCVLFFGSEAVLVATAGLRSDRSYGFRMFPEASTIVVHVSRRLDGGLLVPIEGGRWQARDCSGTIHTFRWGDMVRFPAPGRLDVTVGAPYGVESEVHRTRDALAWVTAHTGDDCETRAFVARIEPRKNGRALDPIDTEVTHGR
jgi:hypothetical protein